MRAWRAVKAGGAVVLRDGVYLLPSLDGCREVFRRISDESQGVAGGVFDSLYAAFKKEAETNDAIPSTT